eukprot:COSAG02_NODE_12903_length_1474_cov_1.654545_2_plen_217_part_00
MASVCLSVYLFACLPACLPAGLPACLPVWLSGCLPVCLPVCLHVRLSICDVAHPGVVVGVVSLPSHQELHPTLPIVPQRHLVPRVRSIHSGVRTSRISVLTRSTVAAPRERHAERCTQAEGQTGRQWCVFRGVCPSAYIVSYRRLLCQPDTRTHTRTLAHTHTHTRRHAHSHAGTQAEVQRYRGAEGGSGAACPSSHRIVGSWCIYATVRTSCSTS